MQSQYWKELYQLKTHIGFIERQLEKSESIDRFLKIVLAIASSSSIGAWAIWNEYSWVWAGIIAFSQVITEITPFLPYTRHFYHIKAELNHTHHYFMSLKS